MAALQPVTPPALERTVKKCLAKDPDERWQNASDLAAELQWIAEGGTGAAEASVENRVVARSLWSLGVRLSYRSDRRWDLLLALDPDHGSGAGCRDSATPDNVQFRF